MNTKPNVQDEGGRKNLKSEIIAAAIVAVLWIVVLTLLIVRW